MKGHVYDFTNPKETSNLLSDTTEEISKYIGRKYKMGDYTKSYIEKMSSIANTKPTVPGNTAGEKDRYICKN